MFDDDESYDNEKPFSRIEEIIVSIDQHISNPQIDVGPAYQAVIPEWQND